MTAPPEPAPDAKPTLLLIDDEANILAALKRLFRPLGYNVLTAESGAEAFALLEKENIDLVICDMRMPQMDGAEMLEQIRIKWPDVLRILLTGYADMASTIAAINRGEIYRYVSKPWDDNDMILIVRDALEHKRLLAEKQRLDALTQRQFNELKTLNATLEDKVRQRTEELRDALAQLKKDYFTTIQVFANLMELRKGAMAGHSRRIAQLCCDIARRMNLPETEVTNLEVAGLLHNIGKIGLPDRLLDRPFTELSHEERVQFDKHPLRAAAILMALAPLADAAQLIRHHREHYNGNSSGLGASAIPLGARILLVASDYESLQEGLIESDHLGPGEALDMVIKGRGTRYDPQVVDMLRELVAHEGPHAHVGSEFQLASSQLREGMLITRDIETSNGMLLLLKDSTLNAEYIRKIQEFEQAAGKPLTIYTHSV
ncbi:HD domain-containing phosphohydrolase [Candidatus Ferrigenium straubiae]|jgi:response regulator RpfG family c-di-GMP phosphodiesterase|uniref:HD domain-containing phosphohydrolase n=1 Tax=Candidatus Ferrigenium straubiae TaxID=2919506 RepID=UPI003F4AC249